MPNQPIPPGHAVGDYDPDPPSWARQRAEDPPPPERDYVVEYDPPPPPLLAHVDADDYE